MKKHFRNFCVRGMTFAWTGPVILAVVWLCLERAGIVSMLTVNEAVLGIVSSAIMVFVAAGISIVYQIENIPKAFAGLIQCAVLYIDYLGIYIINGWIPTDRIWVFTLIFLAVFVIVWSSIYIPIHIRVKKINRTLREKTAFHKAFEPSAPCLQTQERLAPVASYIDIVAIWALIYGAT